MCGQALDPNCFSLNINHQALYFIIQRRKQFAELPNTKKQKAARAWTEI